MQIESCTLCPRMCRVPRGNEPPGKGRGVCKMGAEPALARAALHHWEEPCISGTQGSGTVFFTGCPLGCIYCQNDDLSQRQVGQSVGVDRLNQIFNRLQKQGAHNINLVTAVHFAHAVNAALALERTKIPVVYNSGGYERVQTLRMLKGKIDVYLPDIKCMDPALSRRYLRAEDYFAYASNAVLEMADQVGAAQLDENGIIQKGLIVRHLVLPAMTDETIAVLRWIKQYLPKGTIVSLMGQYVPCGDALQDKYINRRITRREYDKVVDEMISLGLDNGYMQQLQSADQAYIPPFNGQGVEEED